MARVADPVKAIEGGSIAPVYVLYGDEPAAMRKVVLALRQAVVTGGLEAFNHECFEGRALESVSPVLSACAQLPTMADFRLVELTDPDQVGAKKASGDAKSDAAKETIGALTRYIAAPNPTTVLVLSSKGIDGRSRLVTAAKKGGVVHKFGVLARDGDAVSYVRDLARARDMNLARDVAEAIVSAVGTSPSALAAALEKAGLHAGTEAVTADDVDAVVSHTRETVVFELTDAVGAGQRDKALAVLRRIFDERIMPEQAQALALLHLLTRQLRLVWTAFHAGPATAQVAGVPPFLAQKLRQQARGFHETTLRRAYAGLVRLDRDLKGGSHLAYRAPRLAVERWILDVTGGIPGTDARV